MQEEKNAAPNTAKIYTKLILTFLTLLFVLSVFIGTRPAA